MVALLAVYASWQLWRWGPASDKRLIGDVFFYPIGVAAVWAAWSASRRCAGWSRLRRAWRLIALAGASYLLGDIAQTVYELTGKSSFPSGADVFYLLFYPLMLLGVLSFPVLRRERSERLQLALDLAVVALAGCAVVVYVVLGPEAVEGGAALTVAVSVAYPVGDMILLVGLAWLLLRGSAPSARRPLQVLALGVGFYVLADLVYGYILLHSTYQGGDRVDSLWMIAIAALAVAPATQSRVDEPERIDADGGEWIGRLPYAAVACGFAVLLFSDRHDPFFPGLAISLTAMGLAGLVSIRQYLSQRDLLHAQGKLRYQALHDGLTGLPNRLLVTDRTEQLLAQGRRKRPAAAMFFLDLDGFKQVNDSLGHAAGDSVLKVVAERLTSVIREADTVGRLGGDEFVVLLDTTTLTVAPALVAERILEVLRQPIALGGSDDRVSITASIGIATGTRAKAKELMRDADAALYRAKEAGKDRYALFELDMHALADDRLHIESDLRLAIANDEFFLVYQPTFDLQRQLVSGVEALVRWQHPTRGVVEPDLFIPVAERTGLIVPLGRWVLKEACLQAAGWRRDGAEVGVAVNVSGCQLDGDEFLVDVHDALDSSGLDPRALTLEITETSLMKDAEHAAARLRSVKNLGVRVAVDDFGTGYSSLAYLRQFPVDALKIDRSFIANLGLYKEAGALIHTLVQLGKTLGLETLGEGIEEEAQLKYLQREQCDFGQGFLFARPLELDELEGFLRGNRTGCAPSAPDAAVGAPTPA